MDGSLMAIDGPRGPLTYSELDSGARRAARRLAALGVGAGDRVATTLPAGPAFAEILHGAPLIGAVLVPLNTRLTDAERARQAEGALLVEEPLSGEEADVPLREEPDPDVPHTVIFTSGTSGAPKSVELTWRNHVASARAAASLVPLRPGDRWLCVLPVFHVGGLAIFVRCRLAGATVVAHERFDPEEASSALATCTHASLVPTMLRRMGVPRAPGVRAVLLGGGPVPPDLLDCPLPLMPTYGMTETASQVVTAPVGEAAGAPLPGVEVRIAPDGEILLRGEMAARGALADDGWLHTGDLGRLDEDGRLHVEGRKKDVIVTGGENVAAREVEDALREHPAVAEACVLAEADPEWGEAVAAHLELSAPADDPDLDAHCRALLAAYKVPRRFHRHPRLPRTALGKVARHEVRHPDPVAVAAESMPLFNQAANGGDPGPFLALVAPDVDYRPVTVTAEGRWLAGRAEVASYLEALPDAFAEIGLTAEEVALVGDGLVLLVGRWRAVGRASGLTIDSPWASVGEYRDGYLTWLRAFTSRSEALEAAGRRQRGEPDPD